MEFINLTPHDIFVQPECPMCNWAGGYCGNCNMAHWGPPSRFPASGVVARVETIRSAPAQVGDYRLVRQITGEVKNLPGPVEGTMYIVSAMVCKNL